MLETTITERIKEIQDSYQYSPSIFADEIGVQRSSISHILSGRNNPSLDFIQKILQRFPDIDPNWLLTGKGMMKQLNIFGEVELIPTSNLNDVGSLQEEFKEKKPTKKETEKPVLKNNPEPEQTWLSHNEDPKPSVENDPTQPKSEKKIEKIMIFYTDKTFSVHLPE